MNIIRISSVVLGGWHFRKIKQFVKAQGAVNLSQPKGERVVGAKKANRSLCLRMGLNRRAKC